MPAEAGVRKNTAIDSPFFGNVVWATLGHSSKDNLERSLEGGVSHLSWAFGEVLVL